MKPLLSFVMKMEKSAKSPHRGLHPVLLLVLLSGLAPVLRATSWSEPPIVLYGKLLNLGSGTPHPMYQGSLQVILSVNSSGNTPSSVHVFSTDVRAMGDNGQYSYRLTIPTYYKTPSSEQDVGVALPIMETGFHLMAAYSTSGTSQNGSAVAFVDPSQLNALVLSAANRSAEYRVDLAVSIEEADTDGDGMADWWEQVHGLNPYSGSDSGLDPDLDSFSNYQEYVQSTDPMEANTDPELLTDQLWVPAGGQAGLALTVIDADSHPSQIFLSYQRALPGLDWLWLGVPIEVGTEFTYEAVLNGEITLMAEAGFDSGITPLLVRDAVSLSLPAERLLSLTIKGFSPGTGIVEKPTIWLDPSTITTAAVAEWPDSTDGRHDAYQPSVSRQPVLEEGAVQFEAGSYLYLDDGAVHSPYFTAMVAFEPNGGSATSQTVFRNADVQLDVSARAGTTYLQATQNGRTMLAPLAPAGAAALYYLTGGPESTHLDIPDHGVWLSANTATTLPFAYSTIGALYPLGAAAPSQLFSGQVRELIYYDYPVTPPARALVEEYQLSRWEGVLSWNHRLDMMPVTLIGRRDVRNFLTGGFADDVLVGGDLADILRAGPGQNRVAGGGGADRFVFDRSGGGNVVTDFNAMEGDVLDLTEIMAPVGQESAPVMMINPVIARASDGPRVDTVISLDYIEGGVDVHQTITLENVDQLPDSAIRLPRTGGVPVPPTFVLVASADPVEADANWLAVVPDLVRNSRAHDQDGQPTLLFQHPAEGSLVGPGTTEIILTARDNQWNIATTSIPFVVTSPAVDPVISWSQSDAGGLQFDLPTGTILESAPTLMGPWTSLSVSGQAHVTLNPAEAGRYFRLRAE